MAEPNTAAAEQAAEAAFNVTSSIPPTEVVTAVPASAPEAPPSVTEAPAPRPEKPQYARVLEKDWNDLKARAGRMPALESQLARLTESIPKAEAIRQQILDQFKADQAATPAGLAVAIDKAAYDKLAENYPELASQIADVLNTAKIKGTGPAAAETPKPAVALDQAALDKALEVAFEKKAAKDLADAREREKIALLETYPDFRVIVGSPDQTGEAPKDTEWRRWLAQQPDGYRQKVSTTWSPAVVQESIDRFKAYQVASRAPARPDRAAIRRAVIADATTPRFEGNAPPLNPPSSAEEEFVKARRRSS